jgi:hypothetical protein
MMNRIRREDNIKIYLREIGFENSNCSRKIFVIKVLKEGGGGLF